MRLLLSAVAATVVFLVGCGAAENDPNLSAAADKTEATGSSRIDIEGVDTLDVPKTAFSCDGEADYGRRRLHMLCDFEGKAEFLTVGNDLYVRSPTGSTQDAKWFKQTADSDDDTSLTNFSPQTLLAFLRRATQSTETLGDETIRGAATTGYRLTVDCDGAELTCDGSSDVDVWIGEDGIVRRIALEDDVSRGAIEFYDFGVDVDIEAPPPAQVDDSEDLLTPSP